MSFTIFYSWQSDLPSSTNRGFIQKALENVAKVLRQDESMHVEPVVDRDIEGIPGSPNIADTIFEKIERSQVFVCDISIINKGSTSRLTPNPNVLIELGYATNCLGKERIIMILNKAYGEPEHLPFDLRMRSVVTYTMVETDSERAAERKVLEGKLNNALYLIIEELSHIQRSSENTVTEGGWDPNCIKSGSVNVRDSWIL